MSKWIRPWLVFALVASLAALVAVACGGDDDDDDAASGKTPGATAAPTNTPTPDPQPWKGKKLTFAIVPGEDTAKILDNNKVLESYLEKSLPGLDVELFTGPSYSVVIEAAKSEKVDFVIFGPFSYVIAKDTGAKIESALATQADANTPPGYWSTIYSRGNSGINSLADLKGKEDSTSIAFVDPASTSGYLAPSNMLKNAGLDLAKVWKNQLIAGGHDKSALAVYQDKTKVGASFEAMLYDLCKQGLINRVVDKADGGYIKGNCEKPGASASHDDDLVILQKFLLPPSPIAYRTTMDPKLSAAVIDALLNWKKVDKDAAVKWMTGIGDNKNDTVEMVKWGDEKFATIRQMCAQPELKDICPKK